MGKLGVELFLDRIVYNIWYTIFRIGLLRVESFTSLPCLSRYVHRWLQAIVFAQPAARVLYCSKSRLPLLFYPASTARTCAGCWKLCLGHGACFFLSRVLRGRRVLWAFRA